MLEAALVELTHVIEPIFRASHGTTLGYCMRGSLATPILDTAGHRRDAERLCSQLIKPVREQLILACSQIVVSDLSTIQSVIMRLLSQLRLFRLAFLPTFNEITFLSALTVTEGADQSWTIPTVICSDQRLNLLRSSAWKPWALGLASPWRAGYVALTTGHLGSLVYVIIYSIWLPIPASAKRLLRRIVHTKLGRGPSNA
jgi:hypothetical protein